MSVADVFRGIVEGFTSRSMFHVKVLQLCTANGWGVDEQSADKVELYFLGGKYLKRRTVTIKDCGEGNALLYAPCGAFLSGDIARAAAEAMAQKNRSLRLVQWDAMDSDDGRVMFVLHAVVKLASLSAATFREICETLIGMTREFDEHCVERGLV